MISVCIGILFALCVIISNKYVYSGHALSFICGMRRTFFIINKLNAQSKCRNTEKFHPKPDENIQGHVIQLLIKFRIICLTDQYWDENGPIFFYTGNEGPITGFWDNSGFVFEAAQKFNALVIFGEHVSNTKHFFVFNIDTVLLNDGLHL